MKLIYILFLLLQAYSSRPNNPKFTSLEVNKFINETKPLFIDKSLADIYENTFPNTLDTTVQYNTKLKETFIITGDIDAMWLRDSSFQAFPYLIFAKKDKSLKSMMLGLIKKQSNYINIDPYANAFKREDKRSLWENDETFKVIDGREIPAMNKHIWERKFELDSLISPLWFAYNFYENTGDSSFATTNWIKSLKLIIKTVKEQMKGTDEEDLNGGPTYIFQRRDKEAFDTLHQGRGNPVASCGLVKSAFRSSDDATLLPYNIPENAFLSVVFSKVADMLKKISGYNMKSLFLINDLKKLAARVKMNIYKHGVITDPVTKEKYFAYEVDCYGNTYFMDDPGYPSLTSLPFFEFVSKDDTIYLNTRKRILSNKNPYYLKGKIGEGLISPHSYRGYIWPLFTIMRALTTNDEVEIKDCIKQLQVTAEGTGFIHESVDVEDVSQYTRNWFAWANGFFGHLINVVIEQYRHILLKGNQK
jgi:meiotically up-regulated gene 157 (Mug157) protein